MFHYSNAGVSNLDEHWTFNQCTHKLRKSARRIVLNRKNAKKVSEELSAAGQVSPEQLQQAAQEGFKQEGLTYEQITEKAQELGVFLEQPHPN